MPYPQIVYIDGLQAAVDLSVYCYNNLKTYMTYNGDPSAGAQQHEVRNSDNVLIGSTTYIDGRKGNLAMQYDLASDELPGSTNILQPTFIVGFRNRFYTLGEVKTPIIKNQEIKMSAPVLELMAPFIPNLLSTLGQQLFEAVAASVSHTVSCAASNTRTGATVAYAVETFATPGSAAPSGITINASTGLLTVNAAAGTYDVRVVVTDTVTLRDGTTSVVRGFGRYTVTTS